MQMHEPKIVLLVEDNPDDEKLTLRALRQSDVPNIVIVARDGEEALEYLFAYGRYQGLDRQQLPALILLDLKLPKLSGFEVLERLRQENSTATIPVVVMTSSDEEIDINRSYQLGANSFVRKPVEFDEFIDSIRQLGMYWLMINLQNGREAVTMR